ncbi:MAG: histidine phosphatase family protein [Fibrobacter sp.]|nr:histidine phosphatase family protein [Fibrobacter sp.]
MKSKFLASAALAATLWLVACGDEKNPNTPEEQPCTECGALPESSSTTFPANEISSSSVSEPVSSDSSTPATGDESCTPSPVTYPQEKFVDIGEVYKNIQCNEKVVFIVRHAQREASINSQSALTEDGYEAAVKAGNKMPGTEPFKYIFSGMVRTYQTAAGIAVGRGETACTTGYAPDEDGAEHFAVACTPQFNPDTLTQLKDGWYLKDKEIRDAYIAADTANYLKNSNVMITDWVYEGNYADAFYDLDARSKEFLALLVKDYKDMPKYTLAASHDQVLMPLTAWATDKKIDIKLHDPNSRNWLNYLAGVAVIVNDKNEQRYVAIKGMDDNVLPDGTVYDGGIQ